MRKALVLSLLVLVSACGKKSDEPPSLQQIEKEQAKEAKKQAKEQAELEKSRKERLKIGSSTLVNPSDQQVAFAYYQISGLPTPFDEWAANDNRARQANEFDRPVVISNVKEEMMAAAQSAGDIGAVRMNTSMSFGEYDHSALGYRLNGIEDGRYYQWSYNGRSYKLTMENAPEAQLWKIAPEDARAVLEKLPNRGVTVTTTFQIVDAVPESNGGVLKARIKSYDIFAPDYKGGMKLGSMAF